MKPLFAICALLSLTGCAEFNKGLVGLDLIAIAGPTKVYFYTTSSTGQLTQQTTVNVTSPQSLSAYAVDGIFVANSNNSSIACLQYNYRTGIASVLSSTAATGLRALTVSPDGKHIYYGQAGSGTIYYRTQSNCVLGDVQTMAAVDDPVTKFVFDSAGTTVYVLDTEAVTTSGPHKYTRNASTGALTFVASGAGALVPAVLNSDGTVLVARSGANARSFKTSNMATGSSLAFQPDTLIFTTKSTLCSISGVGGIQGISVNTSTASMALSGIPVDPAISDYTFNSGLNAARTMFFAVSPSDATAYAMPVLAADPFLNAVTVSTGLGYTATDLVTLTGYRGR